MQKSTETAVQIGAKNPNGQVLLQRTNRECDRNALAKVWILRCQKGHTYEADSCDFFVRTCPHCLTGTES